VMQLMNVELRLWLDGETKVETRTKVIVPTDRPLFVCLDGGGYHSPDGLVASRLVARRLLSGLLNPAVAFDAKPVVVMDDLVSVVIIRVRVLQLRFHPDFDDKIFHQKPRQIFATN